MVGKYHIIFDYLVKNIWLSKNCNIGMITCNQPYVWAIYGELSQAHPAW